MAKPKAHWTNGSLILRSAEKEDAEEYYLQNYCPLDEEVARLTGSRRDFTHDEVASFFLSNLGRDDYHHFLLTRGDRIIGESIINEFTEEGKSANFRIAIFSSEFCGKGLGSWVTNETCSFAFDVLKLEKLTLDVFAFNPRAIRTYEKTGFVKTGCIEDDDLILMELTKENFIRQ
ncbi:MAG: GNAT family N-acetyltransferase [Bullifex sp.]